MISPVRPIIVLAAAMLLAACDSDSNNNGSNSNPQVPTPPSAVMEFIHASSDAPAVNILIDGTERISNLDFKTQQTLRVAPGDRAVRVDGRLPAGSTVTVIPAAGPDPVIPVTADDRITVIALGDVATISPKIVVDDDPDVSAGQVRLRVLHAAPAAGPVQVWVTAPGALLDAADPAVITANFDFDDFLTLDPLEVASGNYQIRVTPSISDTTVLFDTGTIALPSGGNLVVIAVPNTGAGPAPISLIASTGASMLEFFDVDTPSNVRVVHASSDAPAVDVLVNGNPSGIAGLTFGGVAGPAPLDPGPTTFDVVASPAAPGSVPVISASPSLVQAGAATVFAVGSLALDPANPIEGLILADVTRSIATEAQVRIVHASVIAQNVDIYVQPAGSLPLAGDIPATISPAFSNVPFKANTGYVSLAGASYDIAVTPTGSRTPAIGPVTLPFDAGDITTVVALDGPNLTTPLGALVLDDSL